MVMLYVTVDRHFVPVSQSFDASVMEQSVQKEIVVAATNSEVTPYILTAMFFFCVYTINFLA